MLDMTSFDVLIALTGNSLYYFRARRQLTATAVGNFPINSDEKHNHQAYPRLSGPQATNRCAKRWHNTPGRERVQRIFKTTGVTSIMVIALSACSETSWKEEALLHDGSKVVVSRSVDRGGRSEVGQAPPVKTDSLSFTRPNSSERITWTSTFSQDIGRADFMPLQLDIVNGVAYLVTSPVGCPAYNKWQRPNPPYIVFKHQGTDWKQIMLQELPAQIKSPNLLISAPDLKVQVMSKSTFDFNEIKNINGDSEQPEFRAILREPLSKERIAEMCGSVELYKGHWITPNSPTARAIIDAQQK